MHPPLTPPYEVMEKMHHERMQFAATLYRDNKDTFPARVHIKRSLARSDVHRCVVRSRTKETADEKLRK